MAILIVLRRKLPKEFFFYLKIISLKFYLFIYQTIIKPNKAKISPPDLSFCADISFIMFSMFFIAAGNIAYSKPSITKRRPMAMPSSFMSWFYLLIKLKPDFPKNLKNSLSGDKIKDVCPPISYFS